MATLNPASMTFGHGTFSNPPWFVEQLAQAMRERGIQPELEIYDFGHVPLCLDLVKQGLVEPRAYRQNETFEAAVRFARAEGIIPAPEPAHAIRAVVEEAEAAKSAGEPRVILFGLCGHGHFDLSAYDAFLAGELDDPEFSDAEMEAALERLPEAPALA